MKKLFVSSTFKDMQLERDSLKNHVIPDLNVRLREYGTKITQTDLRWGISTSEMSAEAGEQKILNVCLDEINKSRPYMIVMLGERYGWIPSPAIIDMNARGREIALASNHISVTQLEIEYIAFTERYDSTRIFFYFRDIDCSQMDEETRGIYEESSPIAISKLAELKARIEKRFPEQIRRYSLDYVGGELRGIERFEKLVTEDLYALFCRDMAEDGALDVNVRVREKLHGEALDCLLTYRQEYDIGKNKGSSLPCADISAAEKNHTYIGGSPRCGKTTSVMAHYAGFYAYQHRDEPCWELAEPLFEAPDMFYGGGILASWIAGIDTEKTLPLYLQIGNCKDISDDRDFLRTLLYYVNLQAELHLQLPTERGELISALCESLRALCRSDRCLYLFVDDLNPETLRDLAEIEHGFGEEEIPLLMEHFFFYASFNNQFSAVPVYLPFYDYSQRSVEVEEIYAPAEYFFSYAKRLGKELSAGVVNHIVGYYGGYGKTFDDADLTHITRPHAGLMANYVMNFTAEDYARIKAAGNDMNAIEARQLELLNAVKGNFHDDMSGESLRRVALLNIEKFEANHTDTILRTLGIIYILSGISFSMEEARQVAQMLGEEWSDLEYVSYFDDFKEFFLYNREEDSYRILPTFQEILRRHFIERHTSGADAMKNAVKQLIGAVQKTAFYETKRNALFLPVLLVPDSSFVLDCILLLKGQRDDEYRLGYRVGETVRELLKSLSEDEARALGDTLHPILTSELSEEAVCGFFDGIGLGFHDHVYGAKLLALADALGKEVGARDEKTGATLSLALATLRADCYNGWKNDRTVSLLLEAEGHVEGAHATRTIKYLSTLASLLRTFNDDSPMFNRILDLIKRHLPTDYPRTEDENRTLSTMADMFTLAYYMRKLGGMKDYFDPDALLEPFLNADNFCRLGLRNAAAAICAQDARVIGMERLRARLKMFMESLASGYPSSSYAGRLIGSCMLAVFFNAALILPRGSAELEKYFYPYQKAVLRSRDTSTRDGAYDCIHYGLFLQNALYFHRATGITRSMDEVMWEATQLSRWYGVFDLPIEESIDVILRVCWAYVTYLKDPDFHDMLSVDASKSAYRYDKSDGEEPSLRALHYRLTVQLAAVLHNPNSRIMKPKLKRLFRTLEEHYGDYMTSLAGLPYKTVKKYIDEC
ncbi:MAG: DUF4062 domain-containing protein [Clostridia bacterium]|nr:DUF4062 domain-containing protein [Clostridia bacterium]